ncbi:MAG: BrnT family toxin [bacterium]
MLFEWDEEKNNNQNILKHQLSLEEAIAVFYDPHQFLTLDRRKDYSEEREITIGKSKSGEITLVVVHTDRKGVIRIISARKASKKEIKMYYGYN